MGVDKNRRILVIDDNRSIHDDFRKILMRQGEESTLEAAESLLFGQAPAVRQEGYEIHSAYQGEEALDTVRRRLASDERYALAFVDMRMPPGWNGLQTIERIWEVDPEIQMVMCTAHSDFSWDEITQRLGATDRLLILKKPFDTAEVCQLACALTEKWHLAKRAHLKLSQLNSMVEERTHELRISKDRYLLAAAAANDGLWDFDLIQGTVFYSERWKSLLGFSGEEIRNSQDEWLARVHVDDVERFKRDLAEHLEGRTDHFSNEHRAKHKNGQYRWLLSRGLAVGDPSGKPVRIAGSLTDITERKMAEEQLHHDAFHDNLTGLANRALLTERLERSILRSTREPNFRYGVLFLDLDRFKNVNDTFGHLVGDQLLIGVSKLLAVSVRATDTVAVNDPACLARVGGDEFVLLLDGLRNEEDAIRVATRLLDSLAQPLCIEEHKIFCSASIGIAVGDHQYHRPEDMLRNADTALYKAKSAGKGRYQLFDPDMHSDALARWELENELRRAIERDELRLQFQPIICLQTDRVRELEALVRWQHPTRGLLAPGQFIPLAEETGLIVSLGYWVLRKACKQLCEWASRSAEPASYSIAVNVSGKQFAEPDFVDQVDRILKETKMDPRQLRLEITESAMLDITSTIVRLNQLRDLNLRFYLDDFGTGYSSLSYLQRMPIDALKIDRSFVSAMESDPMSRSVVLAIVTLAHSMGMKVIAEGVETQEQLGQLQSMKCDFAQGFLFARPMDAEAAGELVADPRPTLAD